MSSTATAWARLKELAVRWSWKDCLLQRAHWKYVALRKACNVCVMCGCSSWTNTQASRVGKHKMAESQIPLTFTSAVVFCSPKTQLYSPTSSGWMFLMCISAIFPLCVIWYRPPWKSWSSALNHCTGTPALDSSQQRDTLPPSRASWFFRPMLKDRGIAVEKTSRCQFSLISEKFKNALTRKHAYE